MIDIHWEDVRKNAIKRVMGKKYLLPTILIAEEKDGKFTKTIEPKLMIFSVLDFIHMKALLKTYLNIV